MASYSTPQRSKRHLLLRRITDLIDEKLKTEAESSSRAPGYLSGGHPLQEYRPRSRRYWRTIREASLGLERARRPGHWDDPPPAYSLLEPPLHSATSRRPSDLPLSCLDYSSTFRRQSLNRGPQAGYLASAQNTDTSAGQHSDVVFHTPNRHPETTPTLRNQRGITPARQSFPSLGEDDNNRPTFMRNRCKFPSMTEYSNDGTNRNEVSNTEGTASQHFKSTDGSIDLHQPMQERTSFLSSGNATFCLSPFIKVSISRHRQPGTANLSEREWERVPSAAAALHRFPQGCRTRG
jgi:hypothetical protein